MEREISAGTTHLELDIRMVDNLNREKRVGATAELEGRRQWSQGSRAGVGRRFRYACRDGGLNTSADIP